MVNVSEITDKEEKMKATMSSTFFLLVATFEPKGKMTQREREKERKEKRKSEKRQKCYDTQLVYGGST